MMESKKPIIIPEDIERQFRELVNKALLNNPSASNKPLKYKAGLKVWVQKLGAEKIEILKGSAGLYLVRNKKGEYNICDEEDIQLIN